MRLLSLLLLCVLRTTWSYEVEKITEPLLLGEGPHWNAETQLLYFVDITNSTIHLYDPLTQVHNYTYVGHGNVSFLIPIAGTTNEFLASTQLDIRHLVWNGEQDLTPKSSILYSALQESDGSKFNDAKVDRSGNLWAGTMGPEPVVNQITERTGKLYKVSQSTGITAYIEDILISNGLAWNADGSIMYYIDSGDMTVDYFDYDASAEPPLDERLTDGNVLSGNRQLAFNFTANSTIGEPDGMAIDTDGNLWVGCFNGYQVLKVNPENGTVLMSIPIDASQVTSVAWGGADLDELYVTTAQKGLSDEELTNYPNSGATYRITGLDARGYPGDNYVMYTTTTSSSSILSVFPLFISSVCVLLLIVSCS